MTGLKEYTVAQLALRNGQDREEVWIAAHGKIYDVTRSYLWRNGMHYEHWAGQELHDEVADAPHTLSVLGKFEVVGVLREKGLKS
ncbi:MAG: cytochrome b5 [Cyclobacteriaceae bacterium]|nr:cytochrome b5 [Cyclobacteriaceae bacterium]